MKTRENQTLITNIFGTGLSFSGLAAEVNLVELPILCKGWREVAVCLDIHPEMLYYYTSDHSHSLYDPIVIIPNMPGYT